MRLPADDTPTSFDEPRPAPSSCKKTRLPEIQSTMAAMPAASDGAGWLTLHATCYICRFMTGTSE